jgi:S-(hydroxymethyl)glutathione dehydrogenase/alcohol dehydrogenase
VGATHVVDGRSEGVEESLFGLVGNAGADLFVDNTGVPAIMELGYRVTSSTGRVVLVGVPGSMEYMSIHPLALYFGKELTGSHGGESTPATDIPRLMGMLRAGRLRLDEMVTTCVSLDEINEAIGLMRSGGTAGRCLLSVDGS